MPSAYEVLGVPEDASDQVIKTAYRKAAGAAHPDKRGGDAERFIAIQAAFEILRNAERRAQHDLDPEGTLGTQIWHEKRKAQLKRRRSRLSKLYD